MNPILAVLLVAGLQEPDGGPITVTHSDPPLQVTLPRGYRPGKDRVYLSLWERPAGPADWERVWFAIIPGDRMLDPDEPILPKTLAKMALLPPDAEARARKESWSEFSVDGAEVRFVREGMPCFGIAVALPLQPKSAILLVFAPEPLEKEARLDLKAAVLSARGPASWKTAEERRQAARGEYAAYAGAGLAALYFLAWLAFFRGQPMRAHVIRTLALGGIGVVFFLPAVFGHAWGLWGVIAAVFFISLVIRRVKLAIEG
jgi:hypothetical protein